MDMKNIMDIKKIIDTVELSLLPPDLRPGIGRSLPPYPNKEEMFGWASDIVKITDEYKDGQFRRSGSPGDAKVREYIKNKLISFGIPQVKDQPFEFESTTYENWKLTIDSEDVPCFFWRNSKFTDSEGLKAEAIYVGRHIPLDGSIEGKVVILDVIPGDSSRTSYAKAAEYVHDHVRYFDKDIITPAPNLSKNMPEAFYAAQRAGAVGFVGILDYPTGTNKFYPDVGLSVRDLMPGVMVGKGDGEKLKAKFKDNSDKIHAEIVLTGNINKRAQSGNVVGILPGVTDEILIINTHHDGCFSSAVEDASGIASVLALAKFYAEYVPDLRVKTLVFDFEGNHWSWDYPYGSRKFAEQNPDILEKTNAVLGIEHIAREMKVEDGKYVDAGHPAATTLFSPDSPELKKIVIDAIIKNDLTYTVVPYRSGEDFMIPAQTRWFHLQGFPVFQYISGPEYLYLADDTLDKIDKDRFEAVNRTFIDLIERLQYIPRNRMIPGPTNHISKPINYNL
ncbi:MAG: M28 family peptidase [Rhizobiales bacterium]|nr:M28 family peptidase [Hyphomicrobiales bacterium]